MPTVVTVADEDIRRLDSPRLVEVEGHAGGG
jgi:hypothetical protein